MLEDSKQKIHLVMIVIFFSEAYNFLKQPFLCISVSV